MSTTYGPLTEKESRKGKGEVLQQENPVSAGSGGDKKGKKGKKGGNVAQPLRVDAMSTDSGICNGNDVLKFLDLTSNGPMTDEDNGAAAEYFQKKKHSFYDSFKKLDASGCDGIDEELSKLISNKVEGIIKLNVPTLKKIYVYIYLRVVYYLHEYTLFSGNLT